jgi:hypothetical protein
MFKNLFLVLAMQRPVRSVIKDWVALPTGGPISRRRTQFVALSVMVADCQIEMQGGTIWVDRTNTMDQDFLTDWDNVRIGTRQRRRRAGPRRATLDMKPEHRNSLTRCVVAARDLVKKRAGFVVSMRRSVALMALPTGARGSPGKTAWTPSVTLVPKMLVTNDATMISVPGNKHCASTLESRIPSGVVRPLIVAHSLISETCAATIVRLAARRQHPIEGPLAG